MVEDLPRHRRLSDEGNEAQSSSALGQASTSKSNTFWRRQPREAVGPQGEQLAVSAGSAATLVVARHALSLRSVPRVLLGTAALAGSSSESGTTRLRSLALGANTPW